MPLPLQLSFFLNLNFIKHISNNWYIGGIIIKSSWKKIEYLKLIAHARDSFYI